jgi:hypothetical protein
VGEAMKLFACVLLAFALLGACGSPAPHQPPPTPPPADEPDAAPPTPPGRDAAPAPDAPSVKYDAAAADGTASSGPDAAASRDGAPPRDGAVSSPDAAPAADAAPPAMGTRTSLRDALANVWKGARETILMEGDVMVFRGVYQAGQIGGPSGHNKRLSLKPGRDYLLEYRIRFDSGFDFSRGGKIPGLAGATAPTGCVTQAGDGFSARMMWRQQGALIGYTYDNDQSTECGNGHPTGFRFGVGQWYAMKERVKINTGTAHNGVLQIWVDDKLVLDQSNLSYMNEAANRRIDVVLFHSFFGGSTNDWAPSRDVSISFSEVYATLLAE